MSVENSKAVIVVTKEGFRGLLRNKKVIIAAIIVILIIAGCATFLVLHSRNTESPLEKKRQEGVTALQDKVSKATSKSQKATLYTQLGSTYMNQQNYSAALNAYQQAAKNESLDNELAQNLAYAYQLTGDKKDAIKYYQDAINLWPKSDPTGGATIANLQSEIKALQGNAQ